MSAEHEMRDAVRRQIEQAYGPDVVREALDSDEARSYIAARREADAREAAYLAAADEHAREITGMLNSGGIPLPGGLKLLEGMRFEWK